MQHPPQIARFQLFGQRAAKQKEPPPFGQRLFKRFRFDLEAGSYLKATARIVNDFFDSIFFAFLRVFFAMVFLLVRRRASCAIGRFHRRSGLSAGALLNRGATLKDRESLLRLQFLSLLQRLLGLAHQKSRPCRLANVSAQNLRAATRSG